MELRFVADQCSPLDRRQRIQMVQGNDLSSFLHERASLPGVEMCAGVSGRNQSRPMPPYLGNGDAVDLFKLFVHVKKRGGYDTISRDGLWDQIGQDQGLMCSGLGSALKLIYYMYFLSSEKESTNISGAVESEGEALYGNLGLEEDDLVAFTLKNSKEMKKNEEESEEGSTDGGVKLCNEKKDWTFEEVEVFDIHSDSSDSAVGDISEPDRASNVDTSTRIPANVERCLRTNTGEKQEKMAEDLNPTKKESSSAKRKRECALSKMLAWLDSVAKDPANLAIGTLPESFDCKSYGGDHYWKQVLLTRAALFHKKPVDLSPEQFPWQKRQKMHPSMFDEAGESAEKVRSSPRLRLSSSLGTSSNHLSSLSSFNLRKRIPVGPFFQAEVPEWTGVPTESDSKWLGTRIWPPKDKTLVYVNKDDPSQKITRNREFPGSTESIKQHVSRRRMKLKIELGSAFHSWKFDKMGEEVASSWTKKEEKKFEAVVRENPLSQGKCFWDEMSKTLSTKTRQELVSYYFNVFLLRRRAHQNRCSLSNIDSDDDETEFIAKSSSLILSPGKKKNVD